MSVLSRVSLVALAAITVLIVPCVISPTASSLTPTSDSLLQNPGFENGLSPWSVCGGEAVRSTALTAPRGSWSVTLSKAAGMGEASVCQQVSVTPLVLYAVSGYFFAGSAGATAPFVQMVWQTASGPVTSGDLLAACPIGAWCLRTMAARAPANAFSAVIRAGVYVTSGADYAYVDDTALVQTAPPSTQTATVSATPTPSRTATATFTRPPAATHSKTRTPSATQTPLPAGTPSGTPRPSATQTANMTPPLPVALINEVEYNCRHAGTETDCEWLELYNPSPVSVTLTGWTVRDNFASTLLPDLTIGPHALLVVAAQRAAFVENYPQFAGVLIELGRPLGNGLANGGDRLILSDAGGRRVDALSYGDDTSIFSPAIAGIGAKGQSLERRPAGYDTDQASDFFEQIQPSPGQGWAAPTPTVAPTASTTPSPSETVTATPDAGATATATETVSPTAVPTPPASIAYLPIIVHEATPTPTPSATPNPRLVTLNEFLPAPDVIDWNGDGKTDSDDEWIELYNGAAVAVDVSGWALDDEENDGSPLYFLPAGTVMPPHSFLVLYGKQTGLSLANTKDVVRLLLRTGELLEEYRYYATWKDRSFSKTEDGGAPWTYWYPPSPGQPNKP